MIVNKFFFVLILVAVSKISAAQVDSIFPEILGSFPGGDQALDCFIDSLINKDLVHSQQQEGKVVVGFTLNKQGELKDFRILKSYSQKIDNEFLRVLKLMPNWTPGKQDGEKVEQKFLLPLKFPYDRGKFCR